MDTTLVILGGAALALYYFSKKKINELQSRIDQNEKDQKNIEEDLTKVNDRIENHIPDGDIAVGAYVLFTNINGQYWGGRVVWEIYNRTNNTPYVLNGIMGQFYLNGHPLNFLPANSDMFPYKIQGGTRYDAYCTKNNFTWINNRNAREGIKNALSPKGSTGRYILTGTSVLEITNSATGQRFYKTFRNIIGEAVWVGGTDYKKAGAIANDDPNWSSFVEKL